MCSGVRGRGWGRNPLNPLKWAVGVGFIHETCEVYQSNSDTHRRVIHLTILGKISYLI